jgi:hypothetical protein
LASAEADEDEDEDGDGDGDANGSEDAEEDADAAADAEGDGERCRAPVEGRPVSGLMPPWGRIPPGVRPSPAAPKGSSEDGLREVPQPMKAAASTPA